MNLFWIWIGLLVLGFGGYFGLLRLKHRDYAPFRIRLTGFFLLFVLIPAIPSAYLIAQLMTRSADVLLMPGMDEALNAGLDAIRLQSETKGRRVLETQTPDRWNDALLKREDLDQLTLYRVTGDSFHHIQSLSRDESLPLWTPRTGTWAAAQAGQHSLILDGALDGHIAVLHCLGDSTLAAAVYALEPAVLHAKERITRSLRVYAALSLLKESLLEKGVIWSLAVLVVFLLAFLAAGAATRLSRHISRPVQDLVTGMGRVAEGDLTTQIETPAKDEFKLLVGSFNQMTTDLDESRKKLVEAERLAAWQSVARQISHEIKNSLTPLAISLRRLRDHFGATPPPGRVAESLTAVEDELRSLEQMAGEFSQFARMPALQKGPVDLNALIRQVVELVNPGLDGRLLETDLASHLPAIEADREQLKRVLHNLVKNALEATAPGDTVTLRTAPSDQADKQLCLEVADTGQGMDAETLARAFEPYFSRKGRGTGLGLAMVRQIVEGHGGRLAVESTPGQGTRFLLHL